MNNKLLNQLEAKLQTLFEDQIVAILPGVSMEPSTLFLTQFTRVQCQYFCIGASAKLHEHMHINECG